MPGVRDRDPTSRRSGARSWSTWTRSTWTGDAGDAPVPGPHGRVRGRATAAGEGSRREPTRAPSRRPARRGAGRRPGAGMTLEIDVLTLFPAMVEGPLRESIPGRILRAGPRRRSGSTTCASGASGGTARSTTTPTAAAPGWSCGPDVGRGGARRAPPPGLHGDPAGPGGRAVPPGPSPTSSPTASHLVFLCPRYEGVDDRVRALVDLELSIGDYVLTGGELAALVIVDAVLRLLPGRDRRGVDRRGVVRGRAARVPAVHPARATSAAGRAGRARLGAPRAGAPLAPPRIAAPHPGPAAGPPGGPRPLEGRGQGDGRAARRRSRRARRRGGRAWHRA